MELEHTVIHEEYLTIKLSDEDINPFMTMIGQVVVESQRTGLRNDWRQHRVIGEEILKQLMSLYGEDRNDEYQDE